MSTRPIERDTVLPTSPPSPSFAPAAAVTPEGFSAAFERCFARAYAYVSRRVEDRGTCERIVSRVLEMNLDLLVDGAEERRGIGRLKASLDRLIGAESAKRISTGTVEP